MNKKILLIKIGGSLITDKSQPFTARPDVIEAFARDLSQVVAANEVSLVVGHGGGSFPHQPAHEYSVQLGINSEETVRGIALVQDAAARLNRIVVEAFLKQGINAISWNPSTTVMTSAQEVRQADFTALEKMLELKMVVVPYGDVVLDLSQGCAIASTEKILVAIGVYLQQRGHALEGFISLGDTPGVYRDLQKRELGVYDKISAQDNTSAMDAAQRSANTDITGGMKHKVDFLTRFVRQSNSRALICDYQRGNLGAILAPDYAFGTHIVP